MIVFPNCKINLGLHVLSRRDDGFHNLGTVFYPIPLQDALEVIHNGGSQTSLTTTGLPIEGKEGDNSCFKAWQLLKKEFSDLPPVAIHLHKVIPAGAGLGGGSANGAFMLLLLNRKFNLQLTEAQLIRFALQLGSDCPFFIRNQASFASGRGELMEPVNLDLSSYKIILVNPRIHISTGWAFTHIQPDSRRPSLKEVIETPIAEWNGKLTNDFEAPVFAAHPEIGAIKDKLLEAGAVFASMTGSGSTVYGIFRKESVPELSFPQHYFVKTV